MQSGKREAIVYLFPEVLGDVVTIRNAEVKGDVCVHKVCILQGASISIFHCLTQVQIAIQEHKRHVQLSGFLICTTCNAWPFLDAVMHTNTMFILAVSPFAQPALDVLFFGRFMTNQGDTQLELLGNLTSTSVRSLSCCCIASGVAHMLHATLACPS